jgi:O-succinylbenzoic acid--CoA ligase
MLRGLDLWRESCPSWEERGSFLLLNPRLTGAVRERWLAAEFPDLEEHVWLGTSGTSGNLKMVALARTALEASARAVNNHLGVTSGDVWFNPLPFFHVGGLGMRLRAELAGARHEAMRGGWRPEDYVRAAEQTGATLSALVPAQVHDLVAARCRAPLSLRAVVVGGGALADALRLRALALGWPLLPSYGLTEVGSQVATARRGQVEVEWLPVLEHLEVRTGRAGVLELRGPSLFTGWLISGDGPVRWEDPKCGGWYATSDRVEVRGRELRVSGRLDDLVKIRGELVDVAALERSLQARVTSGLIMLRSVPDERNGVALHVVAENRAAAEEVRAARDDVFPAFARPGTITTDVIVRNALGKPVRA